MADDLDDLLDEVETKFCVRNKAGIGPDLTHSKKDGNVKKIQQNQRSSRQNVQRARSKLEEEVDDILDLDIDIPDRKQKLPTGDFSSENELNKISSSSVKKCFPIYVGGTLYDKGMGSSVSKRICDRLRCTSCDFKVSIFPDYEWSSDTDYLFLRNNAPDFQKLKSNLNRKKGSSAYNCQCTCRSFKDLIEMRDSSLKWVCGKH